MKLKIETTLVTNQVQYPIVLPLTDKEFDRALCSMNIAPTTAYVLHNTNSNLSALNDHICNSKDIEELNYLAQRLASFDDCDLRIYEAIIKASSDMSMKHLINCTFNLFRYDIEPDVRNLYDLGKWFVRQRYSFFDKNILDHINFELLGADIKGRHGQFTSVGYINNFYKSFEPLYDGERLPLYDYDGDNIVIVELKTTIHDKSGHYVKFPATDSMIARAAHKLGVSDISSCYINEIYSSKYEQLETLLAQIKCPAKLNSVTKRIYDLPPHNQDMLFCAINEDPTLFNIDALLDFSDEPHKLHIVK